jgi:hypothetical protein
MSNNFFRNAFECHLLNARGSHALKALGICVMNFWNLEFIFLELVHKLGGIELAIAAAGLDDLSLLLQSEVLPGEVWPNIFLEESENFVVGDGAWVCEVVNPGLIVLGEKNRGWE